MDEKKHIFRTGQRARLRRLATPKVETIEVQPNSQPPADNIGAPQPAPSHEVEDQPNHVLPTDQADAPQPAKSREELEADGPDLRLNKMQVFLQGHKHRNEKKPDSSKVKQNRVV